MKPLFRWAGSKRYLAQHLVPMFPSSYSTYVEPFCGSASLFFINEPQKATLCDINAELINAFYCIRESPNTVWKKYISIPNERDLYYHVRSLNPKKLTKMERAARFIYLNRLCFNGLYRTNKAGIYNVPYSGSRNGREFAQKDLTDTACLLMRAELSCAGYKSTIEATLKNDFIYIDPPYATRDARSFSEYDANSFSVPDLQELFNLLKDADQRGVKFMLSYADCKEMRIFCDFWNFEKIQVKRNIAGFAGHRRSASELIVKNY